MAKFDKAFNRFLSDSQPSLMLAWTSPASLAAPSDALSILNVILMMLGYFFTNIMRLTG